MKCNYGISPSNKLCIHPHPYRVRLNAKGFSHGLKTVHWTVFCTSVRTGAGLSNPDFPLKTPIPRWGMGVFVIHVHFRYQSCILNFVKYRLRRCEVMFDNIVKFCAIAQSEVKCATHVRRYFTAQQLHDAKHHLSCRKAHLAENDRFLSESVVFWRRRRDSNPCAL